MTNHSSVDVGEAAIDRPGSGNELGRADLRGSWQRGGHIQSHLTHSALTFDPRQHCPRVNCNLWGSIALDRRLGPLAGALGGWWREFTERVEAGGPRLVEVADLRGQDRWPMMMGDIYTEIGSEEGRGHWSVYGYVNLECAKASSTRVWVFFFAPTVF